MTLDIATNTYTPTGCSRGFQFFCQVPSHGLIFTSISNSTSKCTSEIKYNLFSKNSSQFFVGFFKNFIIKNISHTWAIFENNIALKEQKIIGTFTTPVNLYAGLSIGDVIGIHQIACNNAETNKEDIQYLRISNVSEQILNTRWRYPCLACVHQPPPPSTISQPTFL
jgi:hypothetical protein